VKRSCALLVGASLLVSSVSSAPAWADGPTGAACAEAYTNAQTWRNERKLVKARDALRICAQPTCKEFIVHDCVQWLEQVQASLPTVVPLATDAQGNALLDVRVSVDGAPLIEKIDGRSVEIDPGPHTFSFEAKDGTKADKQVIVADGDHDKRIAVTMGPTAASAPPAPPAPSADHAAAPHAPADAPKSGPETIVVDSSNDGLQWKAIGLANAGVGAAALAAGSVFGAIAISKKNGAGCNASSVCPTPTAVQSLKDAGTAATTSTVFFVAGGVLAAGGLALWLLAPSSTPKVQAVPVAGPGGGGLWMQGAF
jgi:hypothetical protein